MNPRLLTLDPRLCEEVVAGHEDDVAGELADNEGGEACGEVDPEITEGHRDDTAEDGHPCQQPAPIAIFLCIAYTLLQPFVVGAQIAHQPFFFSERAYPVVDDPTERVAQCGGNEQGRRTDSSRRQCHHDHLGRERQHGACQQR